MARGVRRGTMGIVERFPWAGPHKVTVALMGSPRYRSVGLEIHCITSARHNHNQALLN